MHLHGLLSRLYRHVVVLNYGYSPFERVHFVLIPKVIWHFLFRMQA